MTITIRITLLISLLLVGCVAFAQDFPATETRRLTLPLNDAWTVLADPQGAALRAAWAQALPNGETLTLPLAWAMHPRLKSSDVIWLARDITLPKETGDAGALLVLENPVGLLEVYLDDALLGRVVGNGFTRRLPLRGAANSTHRLTLRLDRAALPAAVRATAYPGLGPISLEVLPPVRIEAVHPVFKPAQKLVQVRYRLSADAPGPVTLRLELFAPKDRKPVARQTIAITLGDGPLEDERTLNVKRIQHWSPEDAAPVVYRLRATVSSLGKPDDIRDIPCGACAVSLAGAVLTVNGEPFTARGLRLPGGIPLLTRTTLLETYRRELLLAKSAGFTAIMAEGAALPEAVLNLADTLGLLVIGEIPLGAAGEGAGELRPDVRTAVEEVGHHPCLVAWHWIAPAQPDREVLSLRALDPTRLVLLDDGVSSRAFPASLSDSVRYADLDVTLSPTTPLNWQEIVKTAGAEQLPLLVSALSLASTAPREGEGLALQRAVANLRGSRPLGYFLRPPPGDTLTGLSTPEDAPTAFFTAALAANRPILLTVQVPPTAPEVPVEINAAIVNDLHQKGTTTYQLYLVIITPDGKTTLGRADSLTLTGEPVQPLKELPSFSGAVPGIYRLQLRLTEQAKVVAESQVVTCEVK